MIKAQDPAAFGRLCVETRACRNRLNGAFPAAFGRLCVETGLRIFNCGFVRAPAAFGRLCVETQCWCADRFYFVPQPPSGGCVLKPSPDADLRRLHTQPPSGGCVLKHGHYGIDMILITPAAFGRLCVETRQAAWAIV